MFAPVRQAASAAAMLTPSPWSDSPRSPAAEAHDAGDDWRGTLRIGYQRFGGLSLVKARGAAPDA